MKYPLRRDSLRPSRNRVRQRGGELLPDRSLVCHPGGFRPTLALSGAHRSTLSLIFFKSPLLVTGQCVSCSQLEEEHEGIVVRGTTCHKTGDVIAPELQGNRKHTLFEP